jgi:HK97 family phage portal protein
MTVIRSRGGSVQVQQRDIFDGVDAIPSPAAAGGFLTPSGRRVTTDDAAGLPAVMAAIRIIAETIAAMPCVVGQADGDLRKRLPDSSQWAVLHQKPNELQTPFDFFSYILGNLNGWGNAYLLKGKDNKGVVRALYPLVPSRVTPVVKGGQITYKVAEGKKTTVLTRQDLIHIPGWLWDSPFIGVTPITLHRNALGGYLQGQEFGSRFFANDGKVGGLITVPGKLTKPQREEMIENWKAGHRGVANAHQTGLLSDGATYQPFNVTMADAAYVESQKFSVQDIARMFRLPAKKLGDDSAQKVSNTHPEAENQEFLQYSLLHWLVRIEQSFGCDDDLFPDKTISPAFVVEALLRADIQTRFQAYLWARQGGILTANEIRAKEDEPPIEGGDVLQLTPVGGAPNPTNPATDPQPTSV